MKPSKVYKAGTYKEAEKLRPKGTRIPKIKELVRLAYKRNKNIFETESGKRIFFWSSTRNLSGIRVLGRGKYGGWGTKWRSSHYSGSRGRVVFMKGEEKFSNFQ